MAPIESVCCSEQTSVWTNAVRFLTFAELCLAMVDDTIIVDSI